MYRFSISTDEIVAGNLTVEIFSDCFLFRKTTGLDLKE